MIFVLKLGFLRPTTLNPIFVFLKIRVVSMRLFSNLFSSKPPFAIFTRNEMFCEQKRLLRVQGFRHYATYRRPSTKKFSKKFEKIFLNLLFFERFSVGKDGFVLLFPVGENGVLSVYLRDFFWRCKIDEILTIFSFYPWFSV